MAESSDDNVGLVKSVDQVDRLNAEFYAKFPYPWSISMFEVIDDPRFWQDFLCQEIADWDRNLFAAEQPRVWVAGCGTNQAVITALRFPKATVVGSDLSARSLEITAQNAKLLGISNLELRQESLNESSYADEFDYVICTGVIHHNADPVFTLAKLTGALKRHGILELMVYNRYHSMATVPFQKAVQILAGGAGQPDLDTQVQLARALVAELKMDNLSAGALSVSSVSEISDSQFADLLVQPVWRSYTVESLEELCSSAGLTIVAPCVNQFDAARECYRWSMRFVDERLKTAYESLPDTRKWQISNLMNRENSPMLWFYVQRADSDRPIKSERQITNEFLDRSARAVKVKKLLRLKNDDGSFSDREVVFPRASRDARAKAILEKLDSSVPLRTVFERAGVDTDFDTANSLRLQLTTSMFPFLKVL